MGANELLEFSRLLDEYAKAVKHCAFTSEWAYFEQHEDVANVQSADAEERVRLAEEVLLDFVNELLTD